MANSGIWLNNTMGVSEERPATSLRTKSIWSVPEVAKLLQTQSVDKCDEVHAMGVKAVPAVAKRAAAERLAVGAAMVVRPSRARRGR